MEICGGKAKLRAALGHCCLRPGWRTGAGAGQHGRRICARRGRTRVVRAPSGEGGYGLAGLGISVVSEGLDRCDEAGIVADVEEQSAVVIRVLGLVAIIVGLFWLSEDAFNIAER